MTDSPNVHRYGGDLFEGLSGDTADTADRLSQLADQLRSAAPTRAWRSATRARTQRRNHQALVDPHVGLLHRGTEKADRVQDLSAGAALFRPARLLLAARHGALGYVLAIEKLLDLEVPRARAVSPRAVRRADAHLQSHAQPRFARHGRRRDDAEPVGVRAPRGLPELLRARFGRAHARDLVPCPAACIRTYR